MNISYSPNATNVDSAYASRNPQQIRADMQAIDKALQTGDLASAQSAFQQLQNDAPWVANAMNSQTASANSPAANVAALGNALQGGDLKGAQQAFAQLRQMRGHHGHHRDQDGDGDNSGPNQDLRTLATALQSGDMSTALSAFDSLQPFLGGPTSSSTSDGNDPLQNLATALQANDPQAAKDAFVSFLQNQRQQGAPSFYSMDGSAGRDAGDDSGFLVDASA